MYTSPVREIFKFLNIKEDQEKQLKASCHSFKFQLDQSNVGLDLTLFVTFWYDNER